MLDEGYIKYSCHWINSEPIAKDEIQALNHWRNQLFRLGLIGQYNNGIGFGNLSIRCSQPRKFIISGTNTGKLATLNEQHYTQVMNYDWERNCLTCVGPIQASSESLTHAAVYEANATINAVIHIHDLELWQKLFDQVPTTARDCAYGTPEMAREIIRLCQEDNLKETKILVMSGHREGIITFGNSLEEAGNILMRYYLSLKKPLWG